MIENKIKELSTFLKHLEVELLDYDYCVTSITFHFYDYISGADYRMKSFKCLVKNKKVYSDLSLVDFNTLWSCDFPILVKLNEIVPKILNKE